MGTKKGQKRKTARRAYEPKKKGVLVKTLEIPISVMEEAMRAIRGKK
tara:strand:+ start:272 stop:412 length:141 start_codon:yes stop_codon:yes gene_type:complete